MTTCESKCECNEGFAGSDCSISTEELKAKQKLREVMLDGLSQTMSMDVVDTQSIIGAASTLQSIIGKRDEVSVVGASKASEVALSLVRQAATSGSVTFQDLESLPLALDLALTSTFRASKEGNSSVTKATVVDTFVTIVNAIDNMGDLIFRDEAVEGNATTLIYRNYRLNSEATVVINVPMTPLEELQLVNGSSSSLTALDGSRNRTDTVLQLQTVEFTRKLWKPKPTTTDELQSKVLLVKTFNIENVMVTINKLPDFVSSESDTSYSSTISNFTTDCVFAVIANYTYLCADSNTVLTHSCNGTAGRHVSYCPVKTVGCNILSLSDGSAQRPDESGCITINSTASVVTCLCKVPQKKATFLSGSTGSSSSIYASSSSPHRLSGSNSDWSTGSDIIDNSGVLTLGAMAYYIANDFKNTFKAAPNALSSAEDTEKVLIVILMFSTVWIVGVLLILWMGYVKQRKLNKTSTNRKVGTRRESSGVIPVKQGGRRSTMLRRTSAYGVVLSKPIASDVEPVDVSDHEVMKTRLSEYVKSVMPGVFNTSSILLSMLNEIKRHHAYFSLLWYSPTDADRLPVLIVSQLLTGLTAMMFLLALLYDLQSPSDDGSCPTFTTMTTCTERKSLLDYDQSYCEWIPDQAVSAIVLPEETQLAYRNARLSTMYLTNVQVTQQQHQNDESTSNKKNDCDSESKTVESCDTLHHQEVTSVVQALVSDVIYTRSLLHGNDALTNKLKVFDEQWGIDSLTGNFVQTSTPAAADNGNNRKQSLCMEECILHELDAGTDTVQDIQKTFRFKSEAQAGVELLQLFIQDLLGRDTDAAKLFRVKVDEDYASYEYVRLWQKIAAAGAVVIVNVFFLYFSLLRGYQKGVGWQQVFLIACLMQIVFDVLLSQTIQCLYINYFLPRLMSRAAIDRVRQVLHDCIEHLCRSHQDSIDHHADHSRHSKHAPTSVYTPRIVDAPSYLFVSTRIAKAYPSMMESMMVLSYHSILPGEISKKWRMDEKASLVVSSERSSTLWKSWTSFRGVLTVLNTMLMLMTVKFMISAPVSLQKLLISFVEPIVLGGLALMWYYVITTWIGMMLFVFGLTALCLKLIYNHYIASLKDTKDEHAIANDDCAMVDMDQTSYSGNYTISSVTRSLHPSSSLSTSLYLSDETTSSSYDSHQIASLFHDYDYYHAWSEDESIPKHWFHSAEDTEVELSDDIETDSNHSDYDWDMSSNSDIVSDSDSDSHVDNDNSSSSSLGL